MIDTQTFGKTAYFGEIRGHLAFLKKICAHGCTGKLPVGVCRFAPSVPTLAHMLGASPDDVARQMSELMRLHWVRKYREGDKVAYVFGPDGDLYASMEIRKMFVSAERTKRGTVRAYEWRWIPVEEWGPVALWSMIREKLRAKRVFADGLSKAGTIKIAHVLDEDGPVAAKRTADFFVKAYAALRVHFTWHGRVHPGLFSGFYFSIKDFMLCGIPRKCAHVRGEETALAKGMVEDVWQTL